MSRRPRDGRRQKKSNEPKFEQLARGAIVNPYPPMEILPTSELDMIHETALRVISELGVQFQNKEAIEILEANGADVNHDTGMVCLSADKVMEWIEEIEREEDSVFLKIDNKEKEAVKNIKLKDVVKVNVIRSDTISFLKSIFFCCINYFFDGL